MKINGSQRRVDAFKKHRDEIESNDLNSIDSQAVSYSNRHLNRDDNNDSGNESVTKTTLTFENTNTSDETPANIETPLLKFKKVNKSYLDVLVIIGCVTLIIGMSLILYFFVFRGLN